MFTDYQFANSTHQADFNRAERDAEKVRMNLIECETAMAWAVVEDLEEKIAKRTIGGTCFFIDPSGEITRRDFEPGGSSAAVMELFTDEGGCEASFERDDSWLWVDLTELTGAAKVVPVLVYFDKHDDRPNIRASALSGNKCEGRNVLMVERVA